MSGTLIAQRGVVSVSWQVSQQSRLFIAEVVGDDLLQKEGGHALWQSIKYALSPGIIR